MKKKIGVKENIVDLCGSNMTIKKDRKRDFVTLDTIHTDLHNDNAHKHPFHHSSHHFN